MKPQRIQLRRTKGFNLQATSMAANGLPAVKCARPAVWGNPFRAEEFGLELAIKLFKQAVRGGWDPSLIRHLDSEAACRAYKLHIGWIERFEEKRHCSPSVELRHALRGKNLACFCALDRQCHCDVLLELANNEMTVKP